MFETILQTSGSDIVAALNLVISAVTAFVALLLLWFTALKGPDIVVVSNQSKVEYQKPPRADLSLTRIEFEPVDVVFANNGTRSGALIEIVAKFKASKGFEPFFWMEFVNAELRSDKLADPMMQLPVIVPDRGTLVVTMKMGLLLRSWKDAGQLDQIQEDLASALRTLWSQGQSLLKRFAQLDQSIGTFELSVRKTARRRLRTTIGDSVVSKLDVPPLPEWVREEAAKHLSKFSEVYPPDDQAAISIRTALDPVLNDVSHNSKLLEIKGPQGELQQLSVTGWERWFGTWRNQNDQTYRGVITRNRTLTTKITDYYQMVIKYNKRVIAGIAEERQTVEKMRIEIKKMAGELDIELQRYHQTLVEATAHLLPVV